MSARVLFWMSERRLQYVCKDQSQNSSNIKHDLLDAMFMIVMADFFEGTENQANFLGLIGNSLSYGLWVAEASPDCQSSY